MKDELNELKKDFDNIEVPVEIDFAIEKAIKAGKKHNRNKIIRNTSMLAAGIAMFIVLSNIYPKLKNNQMSSSNTGIAKSTDSKSSEIYKNGVTVADGRTNENSTSSIAEADKQPEVKDKNDEKVSQDNYEPINNGSEKEKSNIEIDRNPQVAFTKQDEIKSSEETKEGKNLIHSEGADTKNKEMLPTVGVEQNLKELLKVTQAKQDTRYGVSKASPAVNSAKTDSNESVKSNLKTGDSAAVLQSATPFQAGNEHDITKTEGEYVYKIQYDTNNLLVMKNASDLKLVSSIKLDDNMEPKEFYINDNFLLVIETENYITATSNSGIRTKVECFDIADRNNPVKIRELKISGNYDTSKIIENRLYIIDNQNINREGSSEKLEIPSYSDSLNSDKEETVSYDRILYLNKSKVEPNYINIVSLNVMDIKGNVNITSVLGSGSKVKISDDNIFIYGVKENKTLDGEKAGSANVKTLNNIIYKFELKNGNAEYVTSEESN